MPRRVKEAAALHLIIIIIIMPLLELLLELVRRRRSMTIQFKMDSLSRVFRTSVVVVSVR
jgi:hypothetical protein